jgi:adenosylmethionine-8-amino-7-oxononanoate aminotransferase
MLSLVELQVICAFGRLGTMFGCEKYNIKPDLVTIAKVRSLSPLEYLHVANADDTMLLCFGRFYSCELSFLLHAVQQLSSGYMPISAVLLGQHIFDALAPYSNGLGDRDHVHSFTCNVNKHVSTRNYHYLQF